MPVVKMPDGQLVDMPDNPSPEQLARLQGLTTPSEPSLGETLWHKTKLLGSDIVKGAASLPAFVLGLASIDPETGKPVESPLSPLRALQGSMETPKTEADKWQSAFTQGAAGGLISGNPGVGLVAGGASGLGGEAAARSFGEGFLPRLLGGLVAGGSAGTVAGRVGRVSANAETLAREALKGIPPDALEKAKAFMQESARNGVKVDFAQALEGVGAPSSNISTIRDVLANNSAAEKLHELLRNQPGDFALYATTKVDGMPGTNWSKPQAANNLVDAATQRLQMLKDQRTELWQNTYKDGVKALQEASLPAIQQAGQQLQMSRLQLANVQQLRADLQQRLAAAQKAVEQAQGNDAAAVAAANKQIADVQARIANLRTFTLPRGQATDNRGNLNNLPERGASISADQITRETGAENLQRNLPPPAAQAPSLQTTAAQADAAKLVQKVQGAQSAEQAAQASVQASKQGLSAAVGQFRQATNVPPSIVADEITRLRNLAASIPASTPKGAALLDLAGKLEGLTKASQLEEVLKAANDATKKINLNTGGYSIGEAKFIQSQIAAVRQNLSKAFVPYRNANSAYSTFTEDVYNPVKQGPIGTLAGKGYQADVQAPVSRLDALFSAGVDPRGKNSPIKQAASELEKVDKTAFADAAKAYYSKKLADIFSPEHAGLPTTNTEAAGKLYQAFFASESQYQGLLDTVTSVAKSYGMSPEAAARGLSTFAQITKAVSSGPKNVGGLSRQEIFRIGGQNYGADALRVFGFLPFERGARRLEDVTMHNAFRDFDNMLTTPQGVETLVQLSKTPAMSSRAIAVLSTLGGSSAAVGQGTGNLADVIQQ